ELKARSWQATLIFHLPFGEPTGSLMASQPQVECPERGSKATESKGKTPSQAIHSTRPELRRGARSWQATLIFHLPFGEPTGSLMASQPQVECPEPLDCARG